MPQYLELHSFRVSMMLPFLSCDISSRNAEQCWPASYVFWADCSSLVLWYCVTGCRFFSGTKGSFHLEKEAYGWLGFLNRGSILWVLVAQSSHGPGSQWRAVKPGFAVKSGFFLMQGSLPADIPRILHLRVWGSNSRPGLDNFFSLGLPQSFEQRVSGSTSDPYCLSIPGDGGWFQGTM